MNKQINLVLLSVIVIVAIQAIFVKATKTSTVNLNGRNTATVTTTTQRCCNGQNTDVTTSVRATLYDKSNTRTNFNLAQFNTRMTLLDKQQGDEKGHILASVFGGPAEEWNLAPQADNVNRRLTSKNSLLVGWYECEKWIQAELQSGANLPVIVTIGLEYSGSCRPTHWTISARNSNAQDPGCESGRILNGFGGPFTCSKQG